MQRNGLRASKGVRIGSDSESRLFGGRVVNRPEILDF